MRPIPKYVTIYHRLANYAVQMLMEHKHWTAEKAIAKATDQSRLFQAYYNTLKPAERADLARLVTAKRKERREDWQVTRG